MPPFSTSDVIIHILRYEANPVEKVINGLLDVGRPSPGVSPWVKANVVALETPHGIDYESSFSKGIFTLAHFLLLEGSIMGCFPLFCLGRGEGQAGSRDKLIGSSCCTEDSVGGGRTEGARAGEVVS